MNNSFAGFPTLVENRVRSYSNAGTFIFNGLGTTLNLLACITCKQVIDQSSFKPLWLLPTEMQHYNVRTYTHPSSNEGLLCFFLRALTVQILGRSMS